MVTLLVETYEESDKTPVLVHQFPAVTLDEAYEIMLTHAKYDQFLRASITTGLFHGMRLMNRYVVAP